MTPLEALGPRYKERGSFNKVRFSDLLENEEQIVDFTNTLKVTKSQNFNQLQSVEMIPKRKALISNLNKINQK